AGRLDERAIALLRLTQGHRGVDPLRDVARNDQPERVRPGVDPADADVDRDRRFGLAAEGVTFPRVEQAGPEIGLREPLDPVRLVAGEKVPDPQLQEPWAREAGQSQGRRIDADDAMISRVEQQQGVVRLPEEAAGDLFVALGVHDTYSRGDWLAPASL